MDGQKDSDLILIEPSNMMKTVNQNGVTIISVASQTPSTNMPRTATPGGRPHKCVSDAAFPVWGKPVPGKLTSF